MFVCRRSQASTPIPYGIISEVERKVKRLSAPKDKSVRTALVYAGELDPRIEADHGFDFIIPAARLIGDA